jgi:serine/threonine protein kinase
MHLNNISGYDGEFWDTHDSDDVSGLRPKTGDMITPKNEQFLGTSFRLIEDLCPTRAGRVFRAEPCQSPGQRSVAIKFFETELLGYGSIGMSTASMESQTALKLKHPNIVATYSWGETITNTVYIAMEYIEGHSLSDWIQNRQPQGLGLRAAAQTRVSDFFRGRI